MWIKYLKSVVKQFLETMFMQSKKILSAKNIYDLVDKKK